MKPTPQDQRPLAFYIEDSRYSVPSLQFIAARKAAAASIARQLLDQSPDHCAVEVRDEDRLLMRLTRDVGLPESAT